jgi:hypothetical protein
MVSIVNGYVCFNCSDTEKAQKGVDPANPTNDPLQNKDAQTKRDEARAAAKAEAATNGRHHAGSGIGQSASASGGTAPLPALLAPGVGDLLDVTA